jgi:quinol monooxygenase YgiN
MSNPLESIKSELANPNEPFVLTVAVSLKPGAESEFVAVAKLAALGTRRESGNLAYEFHRSPTDATKIFLFEKWRSFADLERHFHLEHTQAILAKTGELSAEPPVIRVYVPLAFQ